MSTERWCGFARGGVDSLNGPVSWHIPKIRTGFVAIPTVGIQLAMAMRRQTWFLDLIHQPPVINLRRPGQPRAATKWRTRASEVRREQIQQCRRFGLLWRHRQAALSIDGTGPCMCCPSSMQQFPAEHKSPATEFHKSESWRLPPAFAEEGSDIAHDRPRKDAHMDLDRILVRRSSCFLTRYEFVISLQ